MLIQGLERVLYALFYEFLKLLCKNSVSNMCFDLSANFMHITDSNETLIMLLVFYLNVYTHVLKLII